MGILSDLRLWAAILAAAGVACGALFQLEALIAVTLFTVFFAIVSFLKANTSPAGTSAGLGALILAVSATVSLLLPLWLTYAMAQ